LRSARVIRVLIQLRRDRHGNLVERRAQLGKLPSQTIEHRLSGGHGLRQRGPLAGLRAPPVAADAHGEPRALGELLLRARRLVRNGRRVGAARQALIEHNRARAITHGLLARFEEDKPSASIHDAREAKDRMVPALDATFSIAFDFRKELQVLEVEFNEIAPIVLGLGLRQMGLLALRNENDLLRSVFCRRGFTWRDLRKVFEDWRASEASSGGSDPLSEHNQTQFPEATARVRSWWEVVLREEYGEPGMPASRSDQADARSTDPGKRLETLPYPARRAPRLMPQDPVNLLLDLRNYGRRLENAQAFIEFWGRLSPALRGKRLELARTYSLADASGEVAFTVMAPGEGATEVTDSTDFAIHSVLEPAALRSIQRTEMPEVADQRPVPARLTCGNVDAFRRYSVRPLFLLCRDCRAGGSGRTAHRLLAPLAFLSPRIIAAIVDGTAPADLTVTGLAKASPHSWAEQERRFGDDSTEEA
jgi:hypothetical protein